MSNQASLNPDHHAILELVEEANSRHTSELLKVIDQKMEDAVKAAVANVSARFPEAATSKPGLFSAASAHVEPPRTGGRKLTVYQMVGIGVAAGALSIGTITFINKRRKAAALAK